MEGNNTNTFEAAAPVTAAAACAKDFAYFRTLLNTPAAYILSSVERKGDEHDYPTSFIYDEYPDRRRFRNLCMEIMAGFNAPEDELWLEPLVEALLMNDLIYRRARKNIRGNYIFPAS